MVRILFLMLVCGPLTATAQGALPFSDPAWKFAGDSTLVRDNNGRSELVMQTGSATRRDVTMQDGTIDFDVMVTKRRSFVYVGFRMETDEDHEEFYLRPHKTLLPDAIQYAPVFEGQSAWQLYHGPDATGARDIPIGVWTHMRVVLEGQQAAIFLGDTAKPILVIPKLARDPKPGFVSLYAFLPAGTPGSGPIAFFSNVSVRPGVIPFEFPLPEATKALAQGVIKEWSVGSSFAVGDSGVAQLKAEWLKTPKTASADQNGMVELNRFVKLPTDLSQSLRNSAVAAHVTIVAGTTGMRRLDLGFSDAATVFLNGRPLLRIDNSYSYPDRRDGLIGFDEATVFLPLTKGRNDLTVVVSDRFGGWGLMGRFPDTTGITVSH